MADDGSETFVRIAYEGERAEMYLGGELAADHFYTGQEWEVEVSGPAGAAARSGKGTGADAAPQELEAEIRIAPLYEDAEIFLEKRPEFHEGKACDVRAVSTATVHRLRWI